MTEKEKLIGAIENLAWYHVDANTGRPFHGARDEYEAYVKYDDVLKTINEAMHEDESALIQRQYLRICKIHHECKECPIGEAKEEKTFYSDWIEKHPTEAAEIIRKWAKEHQKRIKRESAFCEYNEDWTAACSYIPSELAGLPGENKIDARMLKRKDRICSSNILCMKCPLGVMSKNKTCEEWMIENPFLAEARISKWEKEHQEKIKRTRQEYMRDFWLAPAEGEENNGLEKDHQG